MKNLLPKVLTLYLGLTSFGFADIPSKDLQSSIFIAFQTPGIFTKAEIDTARIIVIEHAEKGVAIAQKVAPNIELLAPKELAKR